MTSNFPLCDLPDGYWRVPAGKLANATVWMEMLHRLPAASPALTLRRVSAQNTPEIRSVFNRIGASSLWDRTVQLNQDIHSSPWSAHDFLYFAYDDDARHVGLVELVRGTDAAGGTEIEISYFGLFPQFIGTGMGKRLLAATLDAAWEFAPTRLYLHTCNTDHPSAFAFYRAAGFVPYALGFQIMDDPRSHGWLPKDSAPHVPFVDF